MSLPPPDKGLHSAIEKIEAERRASASPSPPSEKGKAEKPQGTTQQLRSIVDRIVRLEEEKAGIAGDIKEIYEEAKSAGWAKKAVRIVVKREMEDAEQRAAREAVENEAELMLAALGDFASSPLGESAMGRAKH